MLFSIISTHKTWYSKLTLSKWIIINTWVMLLKIITSHTLMVEIQSIPLSCIKGVTFLPQNFFIRDGLLLFMSCNMKIQSTIVRWQINQSIKACIEYCNAFIESLQCGIGSRKLLVSVVTNSLPMIIQQHCEFFSQNTLFRIRCFTCHG